MPKVGYKGIADAKEPTLLSDGPHDLRIVKATWGESKTIGRFRTEVVIESLDSPDSVGIFHYISDPNPEGTEKGEIYKMLLTKRFCHVFDIPFDEEGFDTDDFPGKVANIVTKTDTEQETGRKSTSLVLPELPMVD